MSAKLSTEITHRVRVGRRLLSAFETEGPHVASAFMETTQPHQADGDKDARPGGFLVAVMRKVRAALDHLVETDFAVAHAAARESAQRARRKEDKRQLAFLIVALRRLVLAHFIEPDLDNLGLQPVNVRDSMTILRRGVLVGERFEAVNLVEMLGPRWLRGVAEDLGQTPGRQDPVGPTQEIVRVRVLDAAPGGVIERPELRLHQVQKQVTSAPEKSRASRH